MKTAIWQRYVCFTWLYSTCNILKALYIASKRKHVLERATFWLHANIYFIGVGRCRPMSAWVMFYLALFNLPYLKSALYRVQGIRCTWTLILLLSVDVSLSYVNLESHCLTMKCTSTWMNFLINHVLSY